MDERRKDERRKAGRTKAGRTNVGRTNVGRTNAARTNAARTKAALLAAVVLLCGCRLAVPARPNILLITLDTTRADHLGAYGDRRARTPHLDRLAASGVLFERAITAAPLTLPAHVSLLTGLYPFAHGVRNNGNFSLSDRVPTLST